MVDAEIGFLGDDLSVTIFDEGVVLAFKRCVFCVVVENIFWILALVEWVEFQQLQTPLNRRKASWSSGVSGQNTRHRIKDDSDLRILNALANKAGCPTVRKKHVVTRSNRIIKIGFTWCVSPS